jgi:CheY-like chemotaxis protein
MEFPRSDSHNQESSAPSASLRSALIVTASHATRSMYAEYLAWRGVTVREVTSPAAALDHLSAFTADVVVIEDRLEDGRGVDLVLTLRRSRQTSQIPIALLSADVFGMTPVRAHRFGCDLLIPIPCLPDVLFDALVQLVDDGVTHREPDVLDTWLFVRDEESVRIARRGDCELRVWGPGWKRRAYRFDTELELSTFQADYEQWLVHAGFIFEAFRADRRGSGDPALEFNGPERRLAPAREAAGARGSAAYYR